MFTAIVVLTIMTIPITSSICRELFLGVPQELEEASLGLGATRWEMVKTVVVPTVRGGVVAAIILGLGRALGEAIAVTQVIGNFIPLKLSLLEPGDTLASRVANQYQGATTNIQISSLIYLALHPARDHVHLELRSAAGRQAVRAATEGRMTRSRQPRRLAPRDRQVAAPPAASTASPSSVRSPLPRSRSLRSASSCGRSSAAASAR